MVNDGGYISNQATRRQPFLHRDNLRTFVSNDNAPLACAGGKSDVGQTLPHAAAGHHDDLAAPVTNVQALILDDNLEDRAALAECLANAGYTSVTATTTSQARDALSKSGFDLLVLEAKLPDGDGFQLCHELREQFGDSMLIIFVSILTAPLNRVVGMQVGADDFMSKPCSYDELLARIDARRRRRLVRISS